MERDDLRKVRDAIGGNNADIARLLGISAAAVSRWGGVVPPSRAIEIEKKTGGKVTRHEIRPDYFGPPAATPEEAPPRRRAATFPREAA